MSDYIPNPPNPERDPRNYDRYYNEADSGKGVTLVVGILVAIALAAGLMFFAGSPNEGRNDQALNPPPAADRSATPATPPATPANPAPRPTPPRTPQ